MYQPGMDQGLAQIRYAEALEEAAQDRANRKPQAGQNKPAARRAAFAFAVVMPLALALVWVLAAH